ncbi:MAG: thiamine-phosphate kinase [Candidatus Eremiobacteraeota bacterium]|nr:thiamine-phosphate kinase [Candidatus Eremiobacteraeota bacterium]
MAETGEAEILSRFLAASPPFDGLVVGNGDDAAVWRPEPGVDVVLSQDACVEGIDFVRGWSAPHLVGRRALAAAVSDLAAMGARPVLCQATLCAPGSTRLADALAIHRGLTTAAAEFGCRLAGGDLSAIDGPLVVDVSVCGEVAPGRALRRDRGREGDALLVTGFLGGAAAGLRRLREGRDDEKPWLERQLRPKPRIAEGLWLAAGEVRCAGDLSDGLLVDARRTAAMSGCGAELWLDALPVEPGVREAFGDWAALALGGGEDFELLVAVAEGSLPQLLGSWPSELAPLTRVGTLTGGAGIRLLEGRGGAEIPPPPVVSRHFG